MPCDKMPESLLVESLKTFREQYPLGTKFNTTNVKICTKSDSRLYARAEGQMLYSLGDEM